MKKIRENLRDGGQKVLRISNENVRAALMRMKSEKGGCRDDITVEVCSCLGERAVDLLARLC